MSNKIEGGSPLTFPRTPEELLASAQRFSKSIDERTVGKLLELFSESAAGNTANQTPAPPLKPGQLPPMILAYDRHARELGIPRESWKNAVLEPAFKQNATNPEALHRLIVQALEDGFVQESLPPARQLLKVDPNPPRASSLLGSILLQLKQPDEALRVLEPTVRGHEDANVLVQIAKAYAVRGETAKAEEILSRALTLDPNHKEGLERYVAIGMERDGKPGLLAAYRRIATLPDSWLPQLRLASAALENQDLDAALSLYRQILQKLPDIPADNIPEDVLLRISNDLSKHGALRQMIELVEPHFDAAKQGLAVGANLIAAHLELKDTPAARHILEMLYALQRPDWREHLLYWGKRIDEADYGPMKHPQSLAFEWLRLGNPIWAYDDPDIEALLPSKAPDASRIVLVCGSGGFGASLHDPSEPRLTDALGRLTRFIPLFFAEELHLRTEARSIFLLPWRPGGGFVLSAHAWQREQLQIEELNAAFVLMMHVDTRREPWKLQFSLAAGPNEIMLDTWEQPVDARNPAPAARAGLERILQTLSLLERQTVLANLAAPKGAQLTLYLEAIEQALALGFDNSTTILDSTVGTPRAARFVLDNLLRLATDTPRNARTRCLLVNSLYRAAQHQPGVVGEYWRKLWQLQHEHPLESGPASAAVSAAIDRLDRRLTLR